MALTQGQFVKVTAGCVLRIAMYQVLGGEKGACLFFCVVAMAMLSSYTVTGYSLAVRGRGKIQASAPCNVSK